MDQPLTLRDEADQTRDMSSRSISLRAATLNEADRSVEAVLSTDQPVAVMDWNRYEVIDEVLLADGGDYPRQMPLLECHARYSLDNVLGSVRDIRRDGNNWVGRLFFAKDNERADQAWDLVRQGHVTDVSIGYRSTKFTDIPAGQSGAVNGKTYTATGERGLRVTTAYSAKEGSLVPIGADSKAKVRGEGALPPPPTTAPAGPGKGVSMNPLLRKYLESLGLRADATEAAAQAFLDALGGTQRAIADEVVAGKIKTDADLAARTAPASAAPATAPAAPRPGPSRLPTRSAPRAPASSASASPPSAATPVTTCRPRWSSGPSPRAGRPSGPRRRSCRTSAPAVPPRPAPPPARSPAGTSAIAPAHPSASPWRCGRVSVATPRSSGQWAGCG
jgi:hypothetical protein